MSLRYEIDKYSKNPGEKAFNAINAYIRGLDKEKFFDELANNDYGALLWAIIRAKDTRLFDLVTNLYSKEDLLEEALEEGHFLGDAPRSGNEEIFVRLVKLYKKMGTLKNELMNFDYEVLHKAVSDESTYPIFKKTLQLHLAFGLVNNALKANRYVLLYSAMTSGNIKIFNEVVELYQKAGLLEKAVKGLEHNSISEVARSGNMEIYEKTIELHRGAGVLRDWLEDGFGQGDFNVIRYAAGSGNIKIFERTLELYKKEKMLDRNFPKIGSSIIFWAVSGHNPEIIDRAVELHRKQGNLREELEYGERAPYDALIRAADENFDTYQKIKKLYKSEKLFSKAIKEIGSSLLACAARSGNDQAFDDIVTNLKKHNLLESTLRHGEFHLLYWISGHSNNPSSLKKVISLYEQHPKIYEEAQQIREGDWLNLFYQGACASMNPELFDIVTGIYRENGLLKAALEARDYNEAGGYKVPSQEKFGVFFGNSVVGPVENFEKTFQLMKEHDLLKKAVITGKGGELLEYLVKNGEYGKTKLLVNFLREEVGKLNSPFEKELMGDGAALLRNSAYCDKIRMIKYITGIYAEYGILEEAVKGINFNQLEKEEPESAQKFKNTLAEIYKIMPDEKKAKLISSIDDKKFAKDIVKTARNIGNKTHQNEFYR